MNIVTMIGNARTITNGTKEKRGLGADTGSSGISERLRGNARKSNKDGSIGNGVTKIGIISPDPITDTDRSRD